MENRDLKQLLSLHDKPIQTLLQRVKEFLKLEGNESLVSVAEEFPLDEITALRFVLSAQKKKNEADEVAFKKLIEMLKFRATPKNSLLLKQAQDEMTKEEGKTPLWLPGEIGDFLGDDLIVVTALGKTNLNELAKKYGTVESAVDQGIFVGEFIRLKCDNRTRTTGRLSKMINIVDLDGFSMGNLNMMMFRALGQNSKINDTINPQLVGKVVVINLPMGISVVFSMFQSFASKSTYEKITTCKKAGAGKNIALCPFVSRYVNGATAVPSIVGGKFESRAIQY